MEFVIGMLVGGIVQAVCAPMFDSLMEALQSNKVRSCEGPNCIEITDPNDRVMTRSGSGRWHYFHDPDCAVAYNRERWT